MNRHLLELSNIITTEKFVTCYPRASIMEHFPTHIGGLYMYIVPSFSNQSTIRLLSAFNLLSSYLPF